MAYSTKDEKKAKQWIIVVLIAGFWVMAMNRCNAPGPFDIIDAAAGAWQSQRGGDR